MALKTLVKEKFIHDIIRRAISHEEEEKQKLKPTGVLNWRVLVVDNAAMPIVSSCMSMIEIANEGITIVEDLHKKREPLPAFDTIYVLAPTKESIDIIINDFRDPRLPMYKNVFIFFLRACPDDLFRRLSRSECGGRVERIVEVNMSFLPIEQQVFTLGNRKIFRGYYGNEQNQELLSTMEKMAEDMATLCSTLGEFPTIRYRAAFTRNQELAQMVQNKLQMYKNFDDTGRMGRKEGSSHSQLLILDRAFDSVTPLLHELTYQAMTYELLDIKKDVYSYYSQESGPQEALLSEKDDLWVELRHQHIANVTSFLPKGLKELAETKKTADSTKTSDLKELIQKTPEYQKKLRKYDVHSRIAADCMDIYRRGIDKLCHVEQDLAVGMTAQGKKVVDKMLMQMLNPILLNDATSPPFSEADKIRIILLYIMRKKDMLQENELNRVLEHAQISLETRAIIYNAAKLGIKVVEGNSKKPPAFQSIERTRKREHDGYDLSRWSPLVKDLIEDILENKLNEKLFPSLGNKGTLKGAAPVSARFGQTQRDTRASPGYAASPKLIIYIVGGVTYSEMRATYEVTKGNRNWDVVIGSTHTIVPNDFLQDLKSLAP